MNNATIIQFVYRVMKSLCLWVLDIMFVKKTLVTNTGVIMLHETEEDNECCGGGCQSCKEGCECGR